MTKKTESNILIDNDIYTPQLEKMSHRELLELAQALQVLDEKKKYNKLEFMYLDTGKLNRNEYPKVLKFFEAGFQYKERAMIAANRTGKTHAAVFEDALHATGRYPNWWRGKKFNEPTRGWVVGKTHDTTRDILQKYLLGSKFDLGAGMIPKEDIIRATTKSGVPDAIQDVYVKHYTNGVYDGVSEINFKSYVQEVDAFMGTEQHWIHLDEEPGKHKIYSECLTRTMTTNGIIYCTFTPLNGLSEVVLSFLPGGRFPVGDMGEVIRHE